MNTFNFGYTRLGIATTGPLNVVPSFGFTTLTPTTRGNSRIAPTPKLTDDLTWVKGRHTIQAGLNFTEAQDHHLRLHNEPSYSFSRRSCSGWVTTSPSDVTTYIQQTIPGAALASTSNVTNAFGAIFGMLNNGGSATYNYGINGQVIPFGTPITPQLHFELAGGIRTGHLESQIQHHHHRGFALLDLRRSI